MSSLRWTAELVSGSLRKRTFIVTANGRRVPGVLWCPAREVRALPVVLVCHGGSQSKEASAVLDVAVPLVQQGMAVVAIDGPVHGERRSDLGRDSDLVLQDFLALWKDDPGTARMTADWQAVLEALSAMPELNCHRLGWWGLSMGTAYGLPLCAAEPRMLAAVLGMWGISFPHGDLLMQAAGQVRCPVQFHRKLSDQRFSAEGQEALYAALASTHKTLRIYPGGHTNPEAVQLQEGLEFLARHLLR